jgi:hypothetical protein
MPRFITQRCIKTWSECHAVTIDWPELNPFDGFTCAGPIGHRELNILPAPLPVGRTRNKYGNGPFAKLIMPLVPNEPGLYLWEMDGKVLYVGQTRTPLRKRLGSQGYSTISNYNTFARQPGRTNGGQETNCRVNALANTLLAAGNSINIWTKSTAPEVALASETEWINTFGKPVWNR